MVMMTTMRMDDGDDTDLAAGFIAAVDVAVDAAALLLLLLLFVVVVAITICC